MSRSVRRRRQPRGAARAGAVNMPGFTAEASLVKTEQHYVNAVIAPVGSNGVLAQFSFLSGALGSCLRVCGGDPGCIECCVCVHRGGHPWFCCM
jgi:hypothetical protein